VSDREQAPVFVREPLPEGGCVEIMPVVWARPVCEGVIHLRVETLVVRMDAAGVPQAMTTLRDWPAAEVSP
jgi:hypothetical protein